MKKQPVFVIVFLIAALLLLAFPATAFGRSEPIGDRVSLWFGTLEIQAGAPFFVRHGWIQTSDTGAIGVFDFQLDVDGVPQAVSFKQFSAESGDPDQLTRLWVYAFPEGMSGTHTFTGHWYAPCQYAVDWLGYTGSCANPSQKIETSTRTTVVTFTP